MNYHKTLQSHRCLVGTTKFRCRIIYSTHWSDPMDRLATNHRHRNVHTNRLRSYGYRSRWHRYAAMLAPYAMDSPAEQIDRERSADYYLLFHRWCINGEWSILWWYLPLGIHPKDVRRRTNQSTFQRNQYSMLPSVVVRIELVDCGCRNKIWASWMP